MRTEDVYNEFWDDFAEGDHIARAWRGEGVSLVLLFWLRDPGMIERVAELQRVVARAVPIDPISLDALHITVRYFGELSDQPQKESEFHPDRLPGLLAQLRAGLRDWPAFSVALRRVNSFFICPFFEVHDNGVVNGIRAALEPGLRELGFGSADYGPRGYLPHLTLGYYNEDGDGAAARDVLAHLRQQELGQLKVTKLSLVTAPWRDGMYNLELMEEFLLA
jgi:2'-5' RNA ligase